jgi:hypothetical protein
MARRARSILVGLALLLVVSTPCWGQDVIVESVAARDRRDPGSSFLQLPSTAPYRDPTDWRAIPPWRQTSFFGTRAEGTMFVFVIDCSGSMADARRWLRVRRELRKTLRSLEFPQRYMVIFYNDQAWAMPGGVPASAGHSAATRTLAWIGRITPEGPTEPREAMSLALGFRPSAVYLLSDGEYPEGSAEAIARTNTRETPIHCIDLSGRAASRSLKQIASDSGGVYAAVSQ